MTHRRTPAVRSAVLTAVLTAAAGAGLGGAGTPATADDTPGYSLRHISVDTLVGPGGDQPCTISADVYTPDGADRRHRKPAILTTHGFGGDKADSNQAAIGRGFAREGYVVLSYSGLGFGGSGCKIRLDDPAWDGKAGSQVLDVLAGTRAFTDTETGESGRLRTVAREKKGDPRVGMIGGSYGGQIQYAVAMQDPRVDALVPLVTWNDLEYSLAPNNTDLAGGVQTATPGVAKKLWTDLFFGAGIIDGVDDAQVDPTRNVGCPNFADEVCPTALKLNTLGYPDADMRAIAERSSVAHYLDDITVPTLLVQGQKDTLFNLQEAVATYRGLKRRGTTVKMVWQSWGHSGGTPAPGELDFGAESLRDSYLGRRFLDWMDHHVKGDADAPQGPAFAYFRDWVRYDTFTRRRHRGGEGVRREEAVPADTDRLLVLHRRRRAHPDRSRRATRVSRLRQRTRRTDLLLRDLRCGGQPGRQPGLRRPQHLRVVHQRSAGQGCLDRRLPAPHPPPRRPPGRPDPGHRSARTAGPLRQGLRPRARRHAVAAAPVGLAGAGG